MHAPPVVLLLLAAPALAQSPATVTDDKKWTAPSASLINASEAEVIVRVGDVDNLGFGWPEGFDPFCGRMTQAHAFPWDVRPEDAAPFDRILLSSKLNPAKPGGCGADGYSGSFDKVKTKPTAVKIPTKALKGVQVRDAFLQVFIDDFQAPAMCSRFVVTLNGKRFAEFERLLNAIEQTGPVGKLITVPIPEEFHAELASKPEAVLLIDETLGTPDGFALDFVRVLVNRKRLDACKGTVRGRVLEKDTDAAIGNARVSLADHTSVLTDADGNFFLKDLPTGFEVLRASAAGYADDTAGADVGPGDENPEVVFHLSKGQELVFDQKKIAVGQTFNLNNILFDQGKAVLKKESMPELEKVVAFMKENPSADIELSGHTSSEGDAAGNRSLSYRRVKACKDFVTGKGIDPGRIVAVGHGPDRPVAPNDSEANRKLNRRVEMRVVKVEASR